MDRPTAEAIHRFRVMVRYECLAEIEKRTLNLDEIDLSVYYEKTTEIEEAAERWRERISVGGISPSTAKVYLSQEVGRAGRT